MMFSMKGFGQLSHSQVIGGYLYNFANKISWEEPSDGVFYLVALTENQSLIDELKFMAKNQKINKTEKIELIILSKLEENQILSAEMLFIDQDMENFFMDVFDLIEGKKILLVSENYPNKSYVMLNLFTSEDQNLLFEINKPNIINQGLKLNDEVVLMGGEEIDIAAIYLKSQHSLRNLENELIRLKKIQEDLEQNIAFNKTESETLKKQIAGQNNLIIRQELKIDSQHLVQEQIKQQNQRFQNENTILSGNLKAYQKSLESIENHLKEAQSEKSSYEKRIEKDKVTLLAQKEQMKKINKEIEKYNKILQERESKIDEQKNTMVSLLAVIFIILGLITALYLVYRKNRKKSKSILEQKEEIDSINQALNINNIELGKALDNQRKIQQKLIQSEKMASLGVLSAGIAHEINNPINFVYAGINSLVRDYEDIEPVIKEVDKLSIEDPKLKSKILEIQKLKKENYFDEAIEAIPHIINDIKIGADRTAEIVAGLKSFSRADTNAKSDLDIIEGIESSLILLKNLHKNKVKIIRDYHQEKVIYHCRAGNIKQVFLNLLLNAIEAIEGSGQITIKTSEEDGFIKLVFSDTGCGMSPQVKKKIFDPFFTTKEVGKGTGLGMSITYGTIKDHNGSIKVFSEQGKGSEFIVKLPLLKN